MFFFIKKQKLIMTDQLKDLINFYGTQTDANLSLMSVDDGWVKTHQSVKNWKIDVDKYRFVMR